MGEHPPALDPQSARGALQRIGETVENQMCFWNEFYDRVLEAYGHRNGDGASFMPRNDLNEPNFPSLAVGGGQSTNIYAGGIYELDIDEALLIEAEAPVAPSYSGFQLANMWGSPTTTRIT